MEVSNKTFGPNWTSNVPFCVQLSIAMNDNDTMESHTRLVPSILDLRNVSFLQKPRGPSCSAGVEAVVVVLSAPANTHRRDKLRRQFRGVVAHVQNQPQPNPLTFVLASQFHVFLPWVNACLA